MDKDDFNKAVSIINGGNNKDALPIMTELVKKEPNNELYWLWLSACVETDEQRIFCLRKVMIINPNNQNAKYALTQLESKIIKPLPVQENSKVNEYLPTQKEIISPEQENLKKCPYCAELIKYEAIICRFCGKDITNTKPSQQPPRTTNHFIPKCPTCGSPNIDKISTIDKLGSVAFWGILAVGSVNKKFRCNKCGYEW